jgi:hypothetical protein
MTVRGATRFVIGALTIAMCTAMFAQPATASAHTEKNVYHVDFTYVERGICDFGIRTHLLGSFKSVDHYDASGFLYKTISTVGGGSPFTITATAHGVTLTMRNEAYSTVVTYRRDGSVATYTQRGLFNKWTVPGEGVVLLDTGTATWSEPDEDLLFISGGPHEAIDGDFERYCAAFG